jgi:hypothetical protein
MVFLRWFGLCLKSVASRQASHGEGFSARVHQWNPGIHRKCALKQALRQSSQAALQGDLILIFN